MIVGIDPGSNGGIVFVDGDRVECIKMPQHDDLHTERGLIGDVLGARIKLGDRVFIEEIPKWTGASRFAKQTVQASSLAVLYGNMSLCIGYASSYAGHDHIRMLRPQAWQKAAGCVNTERAEKSAWKNKLKSRATELFPTVKVTLWNADALLIAHAGRMLIST